VSSNSDEIKGKIKQAAGDLTDDRELHREGTIDSAAGKAKNLIDKLRNRLTTRR